MAKRKAAGKIQEPTPGAEKRPRMVPVVTVKAGPEWRAWFGRLTKFSGMPAVVLIVRALMEWAQRNGFEEPPPER